MAAHERLNCSIPPLSFALPHTHMSTALGRDGRLLAPRATGVSEDLLGKHPPRQQLAIVAGQGLILESLSAYADRRIFKGICPSCHSKKTIQFGENVPNNILYPVPHRQFVFSIPISQRIYFKYDRKLLAQLCSCANESLQMSFRTVPDLDKEVLRMMKEIYRLTEQNV
jgi:hypothetical protein